MSLKVARERAREFLTVMEAGKHPGAALKEKRQERAAQEQAAHVAAGHSFDTVRARYLIDHCSRKLRPRTIGSTSDFLKLLPKS